MILILAYLMMCFLLKVLNPSKRTLNIIIMFIVLTFLVGYRNVSFTGDNEAYAEYFIRNSYLSLTESLNNVIQGVGKDPFFYFVGNIFSKLGFSYRGWFVFIAFIYNAGFFYLINKRSKDYVFSTCFMVSLSYLYFSMTGLRQAVAMGFLFFAMECIYSRKPIQFVLLVGIASLFHSSALVFLPAYWIVKLPLGLKQYIFILISIAIAFVFPSAIHQMINVLAWNESLAGYSQASSGLSMAGFVIQFLIYSLCYLYLSKAARKDVQLQYGFNQLMLGLVFQAFVINVDNIFRMSMYFSISGALMLPEVMEVNHGKNKRILQIGLVLVMLLYMLRSGNLNNFGLFGGM